MTPQDELEAITFRLETIGRAMGCGARAHPQVVLNKLQECIRIKKNPNDSPHVEQYPEDICRYIKSLPCGEWTGKQIHGLIVTTARWAIKDAIRACESMREEPDVDESRLVWNDFLEVLENLVVRGRLPDA